MLVQTVFFIVCIFKSNKKNLALPPYEKAARVGFPAYHLSCGEVRLLCGCASELGTNFACI